MRCIELVDGCEKCDLEAAYKESNGHDCRLTETNGMPLVSTCEVFGAVRRKSPAFHALTHEPQRCKKCMAILDDKLGDVRLVQRLCWAGRCDEWRCPVCNNVAESAGPVGCPCQATDQRKAEKALDEARQRYRNLKRAAAGIPALRAAYRRKRR